MSKICEDLSESERGSRFIERIFSVIATCKQHKNDVLTFLMKTLHQRASIQQT